MKITLFPCQGLNLLVPKQGFSHVTIHGFNEKKNYKNYHILVNAGAAVVRTIPNTVNLHKFSAIISSDHRTITYCARSLRVAVHHPPERKTGGGRRILIMLLLAGSGLLLSRFERFSYGRIS